jgi:methyl-accepting chemotaxis protein
VIIIIAVVAQISVSINSMMNKLLTTIQEISETNNIGMRVDVNGKSELSELGKYFNQLLDNIEKLVSGSQVKSKALFGSTESMHTQLQGVIEQFDIQALWRLRFRRWYQPSAKFLKAQRLLLKV